MPKHTTTGRGIPWNVNGRERWYDPIVPQADSEELAAQGARVILYHDLDKGPILRWADVHVVSAGWAIGIVRYT